MQRNPLLFLKIWGMVLAYFFLHSARADFILHPWENFSLGQATSQIQYRMSYFETTTNYNAVGKLISPLSLKKYQRVQNDLIAQWYWKEHTQFFARLAWTYLNQVSSTHPGQRWGLTDQTLGFNTTLLFSERWSLTLQSQIDFPAYARSSSPSSAAPALGDGSLDFSSGIFLKIPILTQTRSTLSFLSGLGYTLRTHGFSSAIPVTLSLIYQPKQEGLFASLHSYSFFSLKTDTQAKSSALYRSTDASGGSLIFQAMNPSLSQLQLKVGYAFTSSHRLSLAATQSIWGQMSPENHQFHLGFELPLQAPPPQASSSSSSPSSPSPDLTARPHQDLPPVPLQESLSPPPQDATSSSEALVLRSHDRLNLVKINQGTLHGVALGQIFEFFNSFADPTLTHPIARGKVTHIRTREAVIEITEFIQETWIAEGFLARPISY